MIQYGRVTARPGKHGVGDWRVEYNGSAPRHAEVVFTVGMLLLAEDRYTNGDGRYRLWYFLDRLLLCKTPQAVRELADEVQESIDTPRSVYKVNGSP